MYYNMISPNFFHSYTFVPQVSKLQCDSTKSFKNFTSVFSCFLILTYDNYFAFHFYTFLFSLLFPHSMKTNRLKDISDDSSYFSHLDEIFHNYTPFVPITEQCGRVQSSLYSNFKSFSSFLYWRRRLL